MSKEAYISYIVDLIRSHGFTSANSAFKFHLTDQNRPKPTKGITQFKQYWKTAQERFKEAQQAINNKKQEQYTESEIKRNYDVILSREKSLEMLSNVAKLVYNKLIKDEKKQSSDILALNTTVERISKLEGWDKPTQINTSIQSQELVIVGKKFAKVKNDKN